MNRILTLALVLPLVAAPAIATANSHGKTPPGQRENNLGELTQEANQTEGWDQGEHASQQPTPRAGLANAGGSQGDLSTTLDLVEGALGN